MLQRFLEDRHSSLRLNVRTTFAILKRTSEVTKGWPKKKQVWIEFCFLKSQQRKLKINQHLNAYFGVNTSARSFSSKGYMPEMQKARIFFTSGKSPKLQHGARSTRTETTAWASVGACFISHNMLMWAFIYCACPCCLILCWRIYSHMWAGDAGEQRCAAVEWDRPPAEERSPIRQTRILCQLRRHRTFLSPFCCFLPTFIPLLTL